MFGFSDSNNNNNSSSSSDSNDIFNNKIIFINFNNIIKTESNKSTFKPKASKPASTKSTKLKSAKSKPKSAKSNNAESSNPNNAVSSNPASANTRNIYGDVLNKLRIIFDEYINKKYSKTNLIKCKPFFNYISSQINKNKNFNFMSRQNLMKQQDTGELILEFINYINMYYGGNMPLEITNNSNLHPVDIINNILASKSVYNNILYYLFGIVLTNKVNKVKRNNTNISTYTYDLQYILELKLDNKIPIHISNINKLFKRYIDIFLKPENTNVARINEATIKNVSRQDLEPIICGKYVIISLIHEKYIMLNGDYVQQKIPIIIKNITSDLVIDDKQYEFIGASEHIGQTTKSGHYVSYIKKVHNKKVTYYLYNDDNVTKITDMNILKNNKNKTYRILIYKCKDDSFYMNDSDNTEPIKKLFNNNASKINDIIQKVNTKLIGSINEGNTCYFNSLLVLLMHIPEFVYLILNYNTIPMLLTSMNNK